MTIIPNHSDEDNDLRDQLEGFGLSDVEDFEKNPFWQLFIETSNAKLESLTDRLVQGDIELYVQIDPTDYFGLKYRTNEALRGAIIELMGIDVFLADVKAMITDMQEELQNQEEEIIKDE